MVTKAALITKATSLDEPALEIEAALTNKPALISKVALDIEGDMGEIDIGLVIKALKNEGALINEAPLKIKAALISEAGLNHGM